MENSKFEAMRRAWAPDAPSGRLEMLREACKSELIAEGEYYARDVTPEDVIDQFQEEKRKRKTKAEIELEEIKFRQKYPFLNANEFGHYCFDCLQWHWHGKQNNEYKGFGDPRVEMLRQYYKNEGSF